jgi:hypothetical protein
MSDQLRPVVPIPNPDSDAEAIERMDDEGPPPGEFPIKPGQKQLQDFDDQDELDEALRFRQEQDELARTGSNELGVNQSRGQNPRGEDQRR